jgi:hypothetical protein
VEKPENRGNEETGKERKAGKVEGGKGEKERRNGESVKRRKSIEGNAGAE